MLVTSNVFMNLAWYWHLRFKNIIVWKAVLLSWGLALFEYSIAVPANRFGSVQLSLFQLKMIQEAVTLFVFTLISVLVLKSQLKWNYLVGFVFIIFAAYFVFKDWGN
jgi:hypothetical protein